MNVRHITVDVGNHKRQGIVERFNRTLALMISRYQESRSTNRYIEVLDDLVYNYNHTINRAINDTPENRFNTNPNTGSYKTYNAHYYFRIGDKVRVLNNKKAFQKGYEPTFSKTIYQIYKGDGYSFKLQTDLGAKLKRSYQVYEIQKVSSSETYNYNQPVREEPSTQPERRNKRELEDLQHYTVEPLNKKRKTFTGNYFIGEKHKMELTINNYKEYMECIRKWDRLSQYEQEQLRKWYRDYYQNNKEKERKRYREYYSSNSDLEKDRVKEQEQVKELNLYSRF